MHKQWQWMCPIGQPPVAMRRPHAHAGSRGAASNPVALRGAVRGVERRRRAWLDYSAGGGERQPAGGVA